MTRWLQPAQDWLLFSVKPVIALGIALSFATSGQAKGGDTKADLQHKLEAEYSLTKTTADLTDIVTPGSVLVLKKDNLLTNEVTSKVESQNAYKNGQIVQTGLTKFSGFSNKIGATAKVGGVTRTFVSGEKLWLTGISVRDKDVLFHFYTDAYNDVRYRASLSIPFAKASDFSVQQASQTISEVFSVQPSENNQQQTSAGNSQGGPIPKPAAREMRSEASSTQDTPPPAIAPPAPPTDAPQPATKTVSLGQSPNEVVAALGKPEKIVNLGKKQNYYYKDLRVIFVDGKVSDVQ